MLLDSLALPLSLSLSRIPFPSFPLSASPESRKSDLDQNIMFAKDCGISLEQNYKLSVVKLFNKINANLLLKMLIIRCILDRVNYRAQIFMRVRFVEILNVANR